MSVHTCEKIIRATCGICGRSWCDRCDPTPSALCHFCHGRGHSEASLDAPKVSPPTDVIFRRWPKKDGGDVIALFPLHSEGLGKCDSYEHVGQHGAASFNIIGRTKPAHEGEPDVDALKRELEGAPYYYRLRVLKRLPHWTKLRDARRSAGLGGSLP